VLCRKARDLQGSPLVEMKVIEEIDDLPVKLSRDGACARPSNPSSAA